MCYMCTLLSTQMGFERFVHIIFQILTEELVHEIDGECEVSLVLILSICLPVATEVALIGYNQELESMDGNPHSPHPNSKPLISTMGGPKGEGNQMDLISIERRVDDKQQDW